LEQAVHHDHLLPGEAADGRVDDDRILAVALQHLRERGEPRHLRQLAQRGG